MKNNFWRLMFAVVILGLSVAGAARAHAPRQVNDDQLVIIKNPEVSQAFYGELKGAPAHYLIDLKEAQDLYFQILVPAISAGRPDLPEIKKDKTVTVEYAAALDKAAISFTAIDPGSAVWRDFYEEYAGDNYLQGPSVKKSGEPGYYFIEVSSPDNTGKYVLVVGEKEEFGALEIVKALITIPQLKTQFFNKPLWRSFEGRVGRYAGLSLIGLIVLLYLFKKFRQVYK